MKHSPEFLRKRKAIIVTDLLSKVEAEDWHGVADAAMDLREIDAKLDVLAGARYVVGENHTMRQVTEPTRQRWVVRDGVAHEVSQESQE